MTVTEFLAELDLAGRDIFVLEWHLSEGEGALIAARTGLSEVSLQTMTYRDFVPCARIMVGRTNRHRCAECPAMFTLRLWPFPRRFAAPYTVQICTRSAMRRYRNCWVLSGSRRRKRTSKPVLLSWTLGCGEKGRGL